MAKPMKLSSVLKNVPIDMMWELRKYHTPNAHQEIRWRARQPVVGKKFDVFGNLKWEDAKSADLYAYDRGWQKRHSLLREEHDVLKQQYASLENHLNDALNQQFNQRHYNLWRPVIEGIETLIDIIHMKGDK